MKNETFEKVGFCYYPTPLEEAIGLEKELGTNKRIFWKRDDTTSVGLGGNKNRKLDYVLAQARSLGCDAVITWAGLQSNHCRQTLAFANKLGMECHLVLNGEEPDEYQGNLLVFLIFGAKIHFEADGEKCDARCQELVKQLTLEGKKPYYVPIGASYPLGSLGYIDSMREIGEQLAELGLVPDHIFLASGSGGTQAGSVVGALRYLPGTVVHGVSVSRSEERQQANVLMQCQKLVEFLGWNDLNPRMEDVVIDDTQLGEGYAIPTLAGLEAMRRVGKSEGILLDPVYTGKAMAALLKNLENLPLRENGVVVFIHTGGAPAVFHYRKAIQDYLMNPT
ncbi:MAG: D-cysteine desulfhydrase family protein [Anaerolineaceae bacterium]